MGSKLLNRFRIILAAAALCGAVSGANANTSQVIATGDVTLWDRLTGNYALGTTDHPDVDHWATEFASRPHEIRTLVRRAEPFLGMIVERMEAAGVPGELAVIPFLESGFDPNAFSTGTAAGLWQFMPATGDRFGLRRTWWYDGRRDVIAATDAAIAYLRYLNDIYDDWLLSMAAYNAGEGRVRSAIRRNRRAGKPTDFWSLDLPGQTEAYVPRVLGLARVFDQPARYDIDLPSLPPQPLTMAVDLPGQIGLAQAADLAGLSMADLRRLNPAYNQFATDPDGPHHLLLPTTLADRFDAGVKALPADARMDWRRYEVRAGDTISELARDFGTTSRAIRRVNNLSSSTIRIGQRLLIPGGMPDAGAAESGNDRDNDAAASYAVQTGDSLWTIARRHRVHVSDLTRWNGLSRSAVLRPGQRLVVAAPSRTERTIYYTVRSGDSLGRIARRYRVRVGDIVALNDDLSSPDRLRVGQRLRIRVDVADHSGV